MEFFIQLMSTVFNKTNVTVNNLVFLIGIVLTAGLVLHGLLSLIFGSFFSFLFIVATTVVFGARTIESNEEAIVEERIVKPKVY